MSTNGNLIEATRVSAVRPVRPAVMPIDATNAGSVCLPTSAQEARSLRLPVHADLTLGSSFGQTYGWEPKQAPGSRQ